MLLAVVVLGPWDASAVVTCQKHMQRVLRYQSLPTRRRLRAGVLSNICIVPERCWTTSLWTVGGKVAQQARAPRFNPVSPWSVHSDEMIYDDVENGDEGGNSSLEYGWSSSEFESYEEQSDSEGKNGIPRSFLRSSHKKQVCA